MKQLLIKDNNATTKMYKPEYRAFKTKIPNNKPRKKIELSTNWYH